MPVLNKYRGTQAYILTYQELVSAARYRGTVTYQEIAYLMHLPLSGSHMGAEVGYLLGEISEDEVLQHRPMLSAIAVTVKGEPGGGFYTWAKALGRLVDESEQAKRRFWESEKAAVYEAWRKELR